MADRLLFPVGFDLNAGVKQMLNDWKAKEKEINKEIAKKPILIKMKVDLSWLDALKRRFASVKITPLSKDTIKNIQVMKTELSGLAKALEAVARVSALRSTASPDAVRASRIALNREKENTELARQKKLLAEAEAAERRRADASAGSSEKVVEGYRKQHSYLSILLKRMAVYASFGAIGSFLTNIREVTAQFELQRVSLGAIIQDQTKANSLFQEIKSFAVKSPVTIMDLTKYVKQVAAYKIETEKLFDTTKRLADISVGLGVPMERLVLLFGQVRATGYLRASEVRQATEAGIPLVEELAKKYSALRGELVTTQQVMDMISKRGVPFKDVEQVFIDMTSAGGAFYDMQEKQGNTLFGLWSKLGDAASIMYDEIGNTSWVNSLMKGLIETTTSLMRNWKGLSREVVVLVAALSATKIVSATMNLWLTRSVQLAAATRTLTRAEQALNIAKMEGSKLSILAASATKRMAEFQLRAAASTNILTRSWYKLRAAMVGNWWILAIAAIAAIAVAIYNAYEKAHRLQRELEKIKSEGAVDADKSVRNFERLANIAADSSRGLKEQRGALEELKRTYGDMLPVSDLTIEKLQALKGNYDSLTASIRDYITQQTKQKAADKIVEAYSQEIQEGRRAVMEMLKYRAKFDDYTATAYMNALERLAVENPLDDLEALSKKAVKAIGLDWKELGKSVRAELTRDFIYYDYVSPFMKQEYALKNLEKDYDTLTQALGQYGKDLEALNKQVESTAYDTDNAYLGQQQKANDLIKGYAANIQKMFDTFNQSAKDGGKDVSITMDDAMQRIIETINKETPNITSALNFDAIFAKIDAQLANLNPGDPLRAQLQGVKDAVAQYQKLYAKIAPDDDITAAVNRKLQELVKLAKGNISNYTNYMKDSTTDMETFNKNLKSHIAQLQVRQQEILRILAQGVQMTDFMFTLTYGKTKEQFKAELDLAQERQQVLEQLLNWTPDTDKKKSGGDNRLSVAQSALSELEKIYNRYQEFAKMMPKADAWEKTNKAFETTMESIRKATKGKINLSVPKSLQEYQDAIAKIRDYMKTLPKSEKAVIEAQLKIDDAAWKKQSQDIKDKIKQLSDDISHIKAVRDFFANIFSQTQDYEMALNLTVGIYGETGGDYKKQIVEELVALISNSFGTNSGSAEIWKKFDAVVRPDFTLDYAGLSKLYKTLKDKIPSEYHAGFEKIISEGEAFEQKQAQQWAKDLKRVRTYGEQLVDLAMYTQERIAEIRDKQKFLAPDSDQYKAYEKMIQDYQKRQDKDSTKIQFEAFKDSPMYMAVFENMENASEAMLRSMRDNINHYIASWDDLDPKSLRELQKRIEEIDKQLANRNPFKTISEGYRELRKAKADAMNDYGTSNIDELGKMLNEAEQLRADALAALSESKTSLTELEDERSQILSNETLGEDQKQRLEDLNTQISQQQVQIKKWGKTFDDANKKANGLSYTINRFKRVDDKIDKGIEGLREWGKFTKKLIDTTRGFFEVFGASDDVLEFFTLVGDSIVTMVDSTIDMAGAIKNVSKIAAEGISSVEKASVILTIIQAALQIGTAIFNVFAGAKAAKANKEIERQQNAIERLEYTYKRLEKAAEKAFGSDYIRNYNQRLEVLEKQRRAYLKQAEAEESKGKKADEKKSKDYRKKAREVADEIADMRSEVAERMLGDDLSSAARSLAQSFIEARKEFGNTTKAMQEDIQELIENMVIESALGKVMEAALRPMYEMVNSASESDFTDMAFWQRVAETAKKGADNASAGAETMLRFLETAGISVNAISDGMTGIARDYASASEESINALTAVGNTQNYYLSQIHGNVAKIAESLSAGSTIADNDLLTTQNQHLAHLPTIAQNTADIIARTERTAAACENLYRTLNRVVESRGAQTTIKTTIVS